MGLLDKLIGELGSKKLSRVEVRGRIGPLMARLAGSKSLRFAVMQAPNFGHQANTLHLMRRVAGLFIELGIPIPPFEVFIDETPGDRPVAEKLKILVKGFAPELETQELSLDWGPGQSPIPVMFVKASKAKPVTFGFCGGYDYAQPLNKLIRADHCILVEPYLWELGNLDRFSSRDRYDSILFLPGHTIPLSAMLGKTGDLKNSFFTRAVLRYPKEVPYSFFRCSDEELKLYKKDKYLGRAAELLDRPDFICLPIYGFQNIDPNNRTIFLLRLFLAAVRWSEQNGEFYRRKIILVLLNDISIVRTAVKNIYGSFRKVPPSSNFTIPAESGTYKAIAENVLSREVYGMLDSEAFQAYTWEADLSKKLNDGVWGVTILCLGPLPQPMFLQIMSEAALPPVFEGQATASAMLSLGKPFLQFSVGITSSSTLSNLSNYDVVSDPLVPLFQTLAEWIKKPLQTGPEEEKNIKDLAFIMNTEKSQKAFSVVSGKIEKEPDKVEYSLLALSECLAPQKRMREGAEPWKDDLLRIREVIAGQIEEKQAIDFSACFPDLRSTELYQEILGGLMLAGDGMSCRCDMDARGEILRLTVEHGGLLHEGVAYDAELVFEKSKELDCLSSLLTAKSKEAGPLEAMPWLEAQHTGFTLYACEGYFPWYGTAYAWLDPPGMELSAAFPREDGSIELYGNLEKPMSALSAVTALCGGLDFTASFPAFFNQVGSVGLKSAWLRFSPEENRAERIELLLTVEHEWVLLKEPRLSVRPEVRVILNQPSDFRNRNFSFVISGEFELDGAKMSVWGMYPPFGAGAALTEGKLDIDRLAAMFVPGYDEKLGFALTELSMDIMPEQGYYSLRAAAETDWEVSDLFTITGLGIGIEKQRDGIGLKLAGTMELLPDREGLSVLLAAAYKTGAGWVFEGGLSADTDVPFSDLLSRYLGINAFPSVSGNVFCGNASLAMADIHLRIEAKKDGFWDFTGAIKDWELPFLPGVALSASASFGRRKPGANDGDFYACIEADLDWNGILLKAWFDYYLGTGSFGITCESLTAAMSKTARGWEAELRLNGEISVGDMVEKMVGWCTKSPAPLESPWNVLYKVRLLPGTGLKYNFTTSEVGLVMDLGEIDLGFARITSVSLLYTGKSDASGGRERGVVVELGGEFFWRTDAQTEPLSWRADKPGDAPGPDGAGNKYFKLTLLALGQHIQVEGLEKADTVEKAIELVKALEEQEPAALPAVAYDPESSWMFAAEMGLLRIDQKQGYAINAQAVFHDSNLYALRLRLQGDSMKILKGLDVQILYRKINDAVGVFQAEVVLPDAMRYLSIGPYSLTLPVFGASIYTNGDFLMDFGFPYNGDFSRSLSIEAVIYPGIPLLGAAGFYFGKLSGDTAGDLVPSSKGGVFNPVVTFGIGIQAGFGKSLSCGILEASFSLTVLGILEGVLAKWNPYVQEGGGNPARLEEGYYYWLSGTAGVAGHLYGKIDFSIIKAEVMVRVEVMVLFTVEAFMPSVFTVSVKVEVQARLTLNLGIIKIKINLSFSLAVREAFSIGQAGEAPWLHSGINGVLSAPAGTRLSRLSPDDNDYCFDWKKLTPEGPRHILKGWMAVHPIAAQDEWPDTPGIRSCLTAMLMIETMDTDREPNLHNLCKANGTQADSSFETLFKTAVRFVIAAVQTAASVAESQADDLEVTAHVLAWLENQLADGMPLSIEDLNRFLADFFEFQAEIPEEALDTAIDAAPADASCFPMPSGLLVAMEDGGQKVCSYRYGSYNSVSQEKIKELRETFDALAVQVEKEAQKEQAGSTAENSLSMADWMFGDYFRLLLRQAVKALQTGLREYQYMPAAGETPLMTLDWIHSHARNDYTLLDLFTANADTPLSPGCALRLGEDAYITKTGDTLASVAVQSHMTLEELAGGENGRIKGLFPDGHTISIPHLTSLPLGDLLAGIQRGGAISVLSGMMSRYLLHGMRIETNGITPCPDVSGMWVRNGSLPEYAGLYALTGQQMAFVPGGMLTFDSTDVSWLRFKDRKSALTQVCRIPMAAYAETFKLLGQAAATPECLPSIRLEIRNTAHLAARAYSLCAGETAVSQVPLTLGTLSGKQIQCWHMPKGAGKLRQPSALKLGRFDESSGQMRQRAAECYCLACQVTMKVKRSVPDKAVPSRQNLYQFQSMSSGDAACLEQLLSSRGGALSGGQILLGISDGKGGIALLNQAESIALMVRTNLSTETNPPQTGFLKEGSPAKEEFIRRIWEASVTNSGGYYLLFGEKQDGRGIPEAAFDENGIAAVTILAAFTNLRPESEALPSYVNTVLLPKNSMGETPFLEELQAEDVQSMVSAGVIACGFTRRMEEAPEDVTADPAAYLRNCYSIMGYRICSSSDFRESPSGMPVGPGGTEAWDYDLAIPYTRFAKDGGQGPYCSIGRTLQVKAWWQDMYGNRMSGAEGDVSSLTTGYGDSLISPAAWPSIRMSYEVDKRGLVLTLRFDKSPYEGENRSKNARQDLWTCLSVREQLSDPNGIRMELGTSLLNDDAGGQEGTFPIDGKNREDLLAWLFGEESVTAYLEAQKEGAQAIAPDPCILSFALPEDRMRQTAWYRLTVSMTLARCRRQALTGLEDMEGIHSITAMISPDGGNAKNGTALLGFAEKFQEAYPYGRIMTKAGSGQGNQEVWVFRTDKVAFDFEPDVTVFGIRPLSNTRESREKVWIQQFDEKEGMTGGTYRDYTDIQTDVWLRQVLETVDLVTGDRYAPWISLLDQLVSPEGSHESLLLTLKKRLADNLSGLLIPVFQDQGQSGGGIEREALRQELLDNLMSFYTLHAVALHHADVELADVPENDAANLYGRIVQSDSMLSLSAARFPLTGNEGSSDRGKNREKLTVRVNAPELVRDKEGAVVASALYNPSFRFSHIEHNIRTLPGIQGYHASDWLEFVTGPGQSEKAMGQARIPMPLCSFPDTPELIRQADEQVKEDREALKDLLWSEGGGLSQMLKWDYCFEYTLPYHYPQDTIECVVTFNESQQAQQEWSGGLFDALAQMAEASPAITETLADCALAIGADTKPEDAVVKKADTALGALENLISQAADALEEDVPLFGQRFDSGQLHCSFSINDDHADIDGVDALVVRLYGEMLPGMDIPRIFIRPKQYQMTLWNDTKTGALASYYYVDTETGKPLAASQGQACKTRQIILPGLDMMKFQSARGSMCIYRNRDLIPGREIAEPFIYRSDLAEFTDPYFVSRDMTADVDISETLSGQAPFKGSFADHMTAFFAELLGETEEELTIQAELLYGRYLHRDLRPLELPVFMMPPASVSGQQIPDIVKQWSDAFEGWFKAHIGPHRQGDQGFLRLDLILFSPKTLQPKQMLRFRRLIIRGENLM